MRLQRVVTREALSPCLIPYCECCCVWTNERPSDKPSGPYSALQRWWLQ